MTRRRQPRRARSRHEVEVAPGTRLAEAVGATRLGECVSHHHQGVAKLGDGLVPVAWTADGMVEGLEATGDAWLVAVQWHPEVTAGEDPVQQRLFDAFAREVSGRKS